MKNGAIGLSDGSGIIHRCESAWRTFGLVETTMVGTTGSEQPVEGDSCFTVKLLVTADGEAIAGLHIDIVVQKHIHTNHAVQETDLIASTNSFGS